VVSAKPARVKDPLLLLWSLGGFSKNICSVFLSNLVFLRLDYLAWLKC